MNTKTFDPDLKINMSLDDIIRLTQPEPFRQKFGKRLKKKRRQPARLNTWDHSVPLPSSLGGGFIYVTKNSPLLRARKKRQIQTAVSNRILNLRLLNQAKKIIPANYKLVKTSYGLERILVPAEDIASEFQNCKSSLWEGFQRLFTSSQDQGTQTSELNYCENLNTSLPGSSISNSLKMEIEDPDDIVDLNTKSSGACQTPYVVDVELDLYKQNLKVVKEKLGNLFLPVIPKTLNDRFTLLYSNTQA